MTAFGIITIYLLGSISGILVSIIVVLTNEEDEDAGE